MNKTESKRNYQFIPITFERAYREMKNGNGEDVFLENEGGGSIFNVKKRKPADLITLSEDSYFLRVPISYIHVHPEDLE